MDITKTWQSAQKQIMDNVSSISFDLWIKTLEPLEFTNGELILAAHSTAAKTQAMNNRHFPHIESALKDVAPIIEIVTIIDAIEYEQRQKKSNPTIESASSLHKPQPLTPIDPTKTFDSFVVGKSNEYVAAAAESVAKNPGKKINPLFIHGGSGLGKTHLLNAIANQISDKSPHMTITFATCDKFTRDYIDALKYKTVNAFREQYRNTDVLLIDDIQFIENKTSTQEEFFHTFNDLHQNGRQIVIVSDRHADKLVTLQDRLRSRFKSGLIQDITTPDTEMREVILQKKANLENHRLPDDVIAHLAQHAYNNNMNVRDMEGMLFKVIFYAELKNRDVPTIEDCHDALHETGEEKIHQTNATTIIEKVCRYFNIKKEDIVGKKRNREFVEPRMFTIYLICEVLNLPLASIGQILGGRDHTTILHSRNKIASQLKSDPRTKRIVEDLHKLLTES